ncbi:hypothetical protein [Streptomyces globisporus]|uniref:hypothetical protein n=1 Tax=Streptomyces globisporus TaxID=1908 RepID=UPI0037B0B3C9
MISRAAAAVTLAALTLLPGGLAAGSAHAGSAGEHTNLMGDQPVSAHDFHAMRPALDDVLVFCGLHGYEMDLSRVTAVEGLAQDECGTILKVTNPLKPSAPQYVMAVDQGGHGLDLNTVTFQELFGTQGGLERATWEPADPSYGKGIVPTELEEKLPGFRKWTCDTSGCR